MQVIQNFFNIYLPIQNFLICFKLSSCPFTCMVFSKGTVHPTQFLVPFMQFVDGSKVRRHIFDPSNHVVTRPCVWTVQISAAIRTNLCTDFWNSTYFVRIFGLRIKGFVRIFAKYGFLYRFLQKHQVFKCKIHRIRYLCKKDNISYFHQLSYYLRLYRMGKLHSI